jgi:hypothetical protein
MYKSPGLNVLVTKCKETTRKYGKGCFFRQGGNFCILEIHNPPTKRSFRLHNVLSITMKDRLIALQDRIIENKIHKYCPLTNRERGNFLILEFYGYTSHLTLTIRIKK